MIDIDDWRDKQILLHGLTKTDLKATFYYDETNNIRKLYIGAQGLNVAELKTFVLGGLLHKGEPHALDLVPLREAMQIQKTAPEIKLEHVAKGAFLDLLRSKKLATFLRWIMESGVVIHYHDLDPFYWSVVDIVDSLLRGIRNPMLMLHHIWLKSDLAEVLKADTAATFRLFHHYGYPGLRREGTKPFLRELIQLFAAHCRTIRAPNAEILQQVLRTGFEIGELPFIQDNTPLRLIEDFSIFYLTRIAVFNQATHILDMEELIRDRLFALPITQGGQPATHFRFVDSKAEPGIQLSDVVVGLLGKMHTYFTQTPRDQVAKDRDGLTGIALENADLLRDCLSRSDDENLAFLNHVASQYDLQKIDVFLRFQDGAFASP